MGTFRKSTQKNTDELADALFKHYVEPYAENETLQKMKKLMEHELTCGDLSHGHGVIKVSWHPPTHTKLPQLGKEQK